jgi:hypothetical protein
MTAWTSLTDTSVVRTYREVPASRRTIQIYAFSSAAQDFFIGRPSDGGRGAV